MIFKFQIENTKLFPGFYESILFNSDTLYNLTISDDIDPNKYQYDIPNERFNDFMIETSKGAVGALWDNLYQNNTIIKDIDFVSLQSPQYYNYRTDTILVKTNFELKNLKQYCFKQECAAFNDFLKNHYTSYDGFVSCVENSLIKFKKKYKNNKELCLQVMLQFYLLKNINIDNYYSDLSDVSNNNLWEMARIYKSDDINKGNYNNPVNRNEAITEE